MSAPAAGRIIAVVAPSGAGKDTLLARALAARPDLHLVRRVITRPASAGGEDFEGVSEATFERLRKTGAFAVWWAAHGLHYGVPASIRDRIEAGETVIFNGSRDALPRIREVFSNLAVISVTTPAPVLRDRLTRRGRETGEQIEARLARADRPAPDGAIVVVNDGAVSEGVARFLLAIEAISPSA